MVYEVADEVALRQFKSAMYVFPGIAALPTVIMAVCDKSALQAQLPFVCGFIALPVALWVGTFALGKFLDQSIVRVHVSSDGLLVGTPAGNKSIARKSILKVQSVRSGAVPVYEVTTREGKFAIPGHKDEAGLLIKDLRSLTRMASDERVYESSKILPYVGSFLPIMMLFFMISGSLWQTLNINDYSFLPVPGFVAWLLLCWYNAYSVCYRVEKKGDRLILSTLLRKMELRTGERVQVSPSGWRTVVKCDQGGVVIPSTITDFDLCEQDLKKFAGIQSPVREVCEEQPMIVLGSKIRPERKKLEWWRW